MAPQPESSPHNDATFETAPFLTCPPSLLIVLSGPSGVGKDTVITCLKEERVPLHFAVTMTTRAIRAGEIDGVSYHFVSTVKFAEIETQGGLLESAVVHGNLYGTPIAQVREALCNHSDVLLKIDVQGAAKVKQRAPDAVFIFLAPPSLADLAPRLAGRGTESPEEQRRRLRDALEEMRQMSAYDYVVLNQEGHLAEAVECIKSIIKAEKCRVHPRCLSL